MFIKLNNKSNSILNLNSIDLLSKQDAPNILNNNKYYNNKYYFINIDKGVINYYEDKDARDKDYERILKAIEPKMYND